MCGRVIGRDQGSTQGGEDQCRVLFRQPAAALIVGAPQACDNGQGGNTRWANVTDDDEDMQYKRPADVEGYLQGLSWMMHMYLQGELEVQRGVCAVGQ